MHLLKCSLLLISIISLLFSRPPAVLPGEELSNETYFDYMLNNALTQQELDDLQKPYVESDKIDTTALSATWNAPSIADQMGAAGSIKLGMGAIFVPRMSEDGAIEPDILIKDKAGKILASGQTGEYFNVMPGAYTIHIGNLAKMEITREVFVEEGKPSLVFPDWCALRIEVIDENAKPIRGEYDLAQLSPLTPIGRGRGRDLDLNEDIKIWFLPPGNYKIIGVGASLNSISNFLTVSLTKKGELIRYTVVQDTKDSKILGGGILIEDAATRKNRNWTHNINIGGSVDLNYTQDHKNDTSDNALGLSMLMYDRFNFRKEKFELNNLVKIDMSLNMASFRLNSLESSIDELRITSLFTYRLFPRFGPYARGEYISGILPKSVKAPTSDVATKSEATQHTFIFLDDIPDVIDDSYDVKYDSTSEDVRISPPFSPINLQAGVGGNVQVFRNRIINSRFLAGFGIDYESHWDTWRTVPDSLLTFDSTSQVYNKYYTGERLQTTLEDVSKERLDYGPELVLNTDIYLGRFISIENESRLFFPFERMDAPDMVIRNLLSLHLTGNVIIDYDYNFTMIQALEEELQTREGRHRILLRFSFSR